MVAGALGEASWCEVGDHRRGTNQPVGRFVTIDDTAISINWCRA